MSRPWNVPINRTEDAKHSKHAKLKVDALMNILKNSAYLRISREILNKFRAAAIIK